MDKINGRLDDENLISDLTRSILATFNAAPRAYLFMTGPGSWNWNTDACDKVSFNSIALIIPSYR